METLFAASRGDEATLALGPAPVEGTPLRLGRVGDRLVAAPLGDHGVAGDGWAAPDAVWRAGRAEMLPGAVPSAFIVAGCEPGLTLAEAMLSPPRLMAISASTGRSLDALDHGDVHAAVIHGRDGTLPEHPHTMIRHHVARWRVGVAASRALGSGSLEDLILSQTPVVQREAAATTQQALIRAYEGLGAPRSPRGPIVSGHIQAARLASLQPCAGLTTESAAAAFGLRFIPLEEHVVELWTAPQWAGHPGHVALLELLSSRAFTERLAARGGYDLQDCGRSL